MHQKSDDLQTHRFLTIMPNVRRSDVRFKGRFIFLFKYANQTSTGNAIGCIYLRLMSCPAARILFGYVESK